MPTQLFNWRTWVDECWDGLDGREDGDDELELIARALAAIESRTDQAISEAARRMTVETAREIEVLRRRLQIETLGAARMRERLEAEVKRLSARSGRTDERIETLEATAAALRKTVASLERELARERALRRVEQDRADSPGPSDAIAAARERTQRVISGG